MKEQNKTYEELRRTVSKYFRLKKEAAESRLASELSKLLAKREGALRKDNLEKLLETIRLRLSPKKSAEENFVDLRDCNLGDSILERLGLAKYVQDTRIGYFDPSGFDMPIDGYSYQPTEAGNRLYQKLFGGEKHEQ
jgi:hypothetical protein